MPLELLNSISQNIGRKSVVDQSQAGQVTKGVNSGQIRTHQEQSRIAQETDADGLILLNVENTQDAYLQDFELYDLNDARVATTRKSNSMAEPVYSSAQSEKQKTLGLAAYEGESFEVHRIEYNDNLPTVEARVNSMRLKAVGLNSSDPLDPQRVNALANRSDEEYLFRRLNYPRNITRRSDSTFKHPLLDDELGYRFDIGIGDYVRNDQGKEEFRIRETRELIPIGNRLYVRLEQGEKFKVRFTNRLRVPVRFGLWVDGVNSIGSRLENPGRIGELKDFNSRVWILNGEGTYAVGYRSGNVRSEAPFVVDREENALATSLGAGEKIGIITGIVYTSDAPVTRPVAIAIPGSPNTRGGVVQGKFTPARVKWIPSRIGPMVAAMSVYYRTGQEIEQLQSLVDIVKSPNETNLFRKVNQQKSDTDGKTNEKGAKQVNRTDNEADPFRDPVDN